MKLGAYRRLIMKSLHVCNKYGDFDIRVGCEIACYPFYTTFFKVVDLYSNVDPQVITIITSDNTYDTRLARDVFAVR